MTKNELMEIASESTEVDSSYLESYYGMRESHLIAFANAILERAAVECEKYPTMYRFDVAEDCVEAIRSLKIDNQAQKGRA